MMDKKEILERSRREKPDEGAEYITQKGRALGITVMMGVFIFIMIYNLCKGIPNDQVASIFWSYGAAESFGRYRITKTRTMLITTILCSISAILNLINYLITTW